MHEYISSLKWKPINCEYMKNIEKLIIQYCLWVFAGYCVFSLNKSKLQDENHPFVHSSVRRSARQSVRPFVCRSVRLSEGLSVAPPIRPSVHLSIVQSVSRPARSSVHSRLRHAWTINADKDRHFRKISRMICVKKFAFRSSDLFGFNHRLRYLAWFFHKTFVFWATELSGTKHLQKVLAWFLCEIGIRINHCNLNQGSFESFVKRNCILIEQFERNQASVAVFRTILVQNLHSDWVICAESSIVCNFGVFLAQDLHFDRAICAESWSLVVVCIRRFCRVSSWSLSASGGLFRDVLEWIARRIDTVKNISGGGEGGSEEEIGTLGRRSADAMTRGKKLINDPNGNTAGSCVCVCVCVGTLHRWKECNLRIMS